MEFFIFRHGETPNNRRLLWQGQSSDVDLNGNGIRQAGDLAHTMQRKNLEVIVSSPYQRALHTAKIVAKQCQIPVPTQPRRVPTVQYFPAPGDNYNTSKA